MKPRKFETRTCELCGKEFQYHSNKGKGRFCSIVCTNLSRRGLQPGSPNQNVRRKWKSTAFSHYGENCEICGYALSVDVHHLIPRSEGGMADATNLSVLCPNHHREIHIGILTVSDIRNFRKQRKVEVAGFEPASRDFTSKTSTSLVNL